MLAFSSETEGGEVSGGVSVCHCAVRTDCRAEKLDPVGSERGVRAGEASYASGLGRSRGSGGVVTCKDSLLGCRLGFGLNFSSLVLSKKKVSSLKLGRFRTYHAPAGAGASSRLPGSLRGVGLCTYVLVGT